MLELLIVLLICCAGIYILSAVATLIGAVFGGFFLLSMVVLKLIVWLGTIFLPNRAQQ